MRKYNVYYHSEKINLRPVEKEAIEALKKQEYVTKYNNITKTSVKYPVSKLKIVECIIV